MELLEESGLTQPGFADEQHELAFARPGALPATSKQAEFLLATDKRRQCPRSAPSATAARSDDAKKLHGVRHALKFSRA